jgi:hypothetical protein
MNIFVLNKELQISQTIKFELLTLVNNEKPKTGGLGDDEDREGDDRDDDREGDKRGGVEGGGNINQLKAIMSEIRNLTKSYDYYSYDDKNKFDNYEKPKNAIADLIKGGDADVVLDNVIMFEDVDNFVGDISDDESNEKEPTTSPNSSVITSELPIYTKDNILELKKKIQIASGIPIYRQHLYHLKDGQATALSYKFMTDTVQKIDIRDILEIKNKIEGIPIEMKEIDEQIMIESFDEFRLVDSLFKSQHSSAHYTSLKYNEKNLFKSAKITSSAKLYLVDIGLFFNNKSAFENIINDNYTSKLIYYSFVARYWPMITFPIFIQYIKDENSIKENYPLLCPNSAKLKALYKAEHEINKEFMTSKNQVIHQDIRLGITSSVLFHSDKIEINLRNLFDNFELNEMTSYMRAKLVIDGTKVNITKRFRDAPGTRSKIEFGELLIQTLIKLPNSLFTNAIIVISSNGSYYIMSEWRDDFYIDFEELYEITAANINPIIEKINSFGKSVANKPLSLVNKYSCKVAKLSLSIYWKRALSNDNYKQIIHEIERLKSVEILQARQNNISSADYVFTKGMYKFNHTLIEEVVKNIDNYYTRFSDGSVKQKWDSLFGKSRILKVIHRYSDLKVEINDIKEEEHEIVIFYILSILRKIKPQEEKFNNVEKKLKKLKEIDPELYDFKKAYQSKEVLSKKCQKPLQPILWTKEEYEERKNMKDFSAMKYWNFTKNEPAYYECPNQKFPHIRFITGVHPKGYCIPCCKKTQPIDNPKNKKTQIHKSCLDNHTADAGKNADQMSEEDKKKNRYIASFGKDIEIGRLSLLPESLIETIFHEDIITDNECQNTEDYYVLGVKQEHNGLDCGALFCSELVLNLKYDEITKKIYEYIRRNPCIISILGIDWAYEDINEMIEDLESGAPKNQDFAKEWNETVLKILSIIYNIRFIIFNVSGENINIEIPNNLNNSADFMQSQIAILIKKKTDESQIDIRYHYYPVIFTNKDKWYSEYLIDKSYYTNSDFPIINIWSIINIKTQNTNHLFVDLHKVKECAKKNGYTIASYYINRENNCYAVLLTNNSNFRHSSKSNSDPNMFYFPVVDSFSSINDSQSQYITKSKIGKMTNENIFNFGSYKRKTNIEPVFKFIDLYNKMWPKITIEKWLKVGKEFIGFESSGLYFYGNGLDQKLRSKHDYVKATRELYYDPDDVNNNISNKRDNIDQEWQDKINKSLYEKYIYQLVLMEFIQLFNSEKNMGIRTKIEKLITNGIQSRTNIAKLKELLRDFPNDLMNIRMIISAYIDNQDIKFLKNQIDNNVFEFDRILLNQIKEAAPHEGLKILLKLAGDLFIERKLTTPDFSNSMIACSEGFESNRCDKKKLIMPIGSIKPLMEILLDDIKNPIKQNILFSRLYVKYIIDPWKFTKRQNEIIEIEFI